MTAAAYLDPQHTEELTVKSAIHPDVVRERGYRTLTRPQVEDGRALLKRAGIPSWATSEDTYFPGLVVPIWRPTGEFITCQWKPGRPARNRDGKAMKYVSPRGQASRLDVHPRNRDRIVDPTVPLWITEGSKKADSLTSRGLCVVALSGVFNWRGQLGTLGDWEDVALRGREVVICFDSDARTNVNVARAMVRLGRWLKSKGVKTVKYLTPPPELDGKPTKGVDDYFAAGGTLDQLLAGVATSPPVILVSDATFSDTMMTETVADDVLTDRFCWASGLGWLEWDGMVWKSCTQETVKENIRVYVGERYLEAAQEQAAGRGSKALLEGWETMLSASRIRNVFSMAAGHVERKAADFDRDPDILNTPAGIVWLPAAQLMQHDPEFLCTKITRGRYIPGYRHQDWEMALEALPKVEREWLQVRMGQGATGHTTPDGILVVMRGDGENGKTAYSTGGVVPALGDYAEPASHKLFLSESDQHSTEFADLRGQRLLVAEEVAEEKALNMTALKRIMDVPEIKARFIRQDNIKFSATHSLFVTTNPRPIVYETDHGTWRRLAMVEFPYTFRKTGEPLLNKDTDRVGDVMLKGRIIGGKGGQHDAVVGWVVEGAKRWYDDPQTALRVPEPVAATTLRWRAEMDRVLGYWVERLVPHEGYCVWSVDLVEDFNRWMRAGNHNPWKAETFKPKFVSHEVTKGNRVTDGGRTRSPANLIRPEHMDILTTPLPAQLSTFNNVRFRLSTDGDYV